MALRRKAESAASLLAGSLFHHELSTLDVGAARRSVQILQRTAHPADTPAITRSFMCQALLNAYLGDWNEVGRIAEQWMARVRFAGRFNLAHAKMYWSVARLALGDPATAEHGIREALPHLDESEPLGALQLAHVLLYADRHEEAAAIGRAYARFVMQSPRFMARGGRALLGQIVSALDETEMTRLCYDQLADETHPIAIIYSPLSVQRVLGRLASSLGLWKQAVLHFDTAIRQLGAGEARWELAQAFLDLAEMRRRRGRRGDQDKAAAMQLRAEAILKDLGALRFASLPSLHVSSGANRFGLTGRELEILSLVAEGFRNQEIAERLTISYRTVERHVENVMNKMGVRGRVEAVVLGVTEGLVGPPATMVAGIRTSNLEPRTARA